MVQLDLDEEMGPMHGMCGTLDAELEVQRAIKRSELTAFLFLFRKGMALTMAHVDNKGVVDGQSTGEMRLAQERKTRTSGSLGGGAQSSSRRDTGGSGAH